MTREDSILTKTWVTNDGRYLTADKITDDHLRSLDRYLRDELTPGSNEALLRPTLAAWLAAYTSGAHAGDDEMDHDVFRAGWLQIIGDEIARRAS